MLRRVLASRAFVSITGTALVVIAGLAAGFVLIAPAKKVIPYCAIMPDAIGLYQGNDVTQRGVKVGSVTGIRPDGTGVRVDFDVDAAHSLRGDVTAATASNTIVADRNLAVQGTKNGAEWDARRCVTKTVTPKSITQTTNAITKVADELQGGTDAAEHNSVQRALAAFDQATTGVGPQVNDTIRKLGAALQSPDASIGHIGALIDALTELSQSVAGGWGNLREMLNGFAPVLQEVNNVWGQVVQVVDSLLTILPWFTDITSAYGEPILHILDDAVPYVQLLSGHAVTLQKLTRLAPAISSILRKSGKAERLGVLYAPPFVRIEQPDADRICALINAADPPRRHFLEGQRGRPFDDGPPPGEGQCFYKGPGQAKVNLVPLLLGMTGAR